MFKNKSEVIATISNRLIKLHYDWSRAEISAEKKDIELEEIRHIADEWDVPLCWELHDDIMKRYNKVMAGIQWVASGCHLNQ